MADAGENRGGIGVQECRGFRERSKACTRARSHVQTARRSQRNAGDIATLTKGREQPSGPASGRQSTLNGGLLTPSVTPAKCISCAAQNAALGALLLSLQVVGVERIAKAAFADTSSSTIGSD
jgi:hypothetical protein